LFDAFYWISFDPIQNSGHNEAMELIMGELIMSMDISNRPFKSFAEFYPYYLSEHWQPACRVMHYVGTAFTFVFLILGIFVSLLFWLCIPLVGYGFAWISHAFIEKNRPATFTYPLWSLVGDYKMFFSALTGKLPAQLGEAEKYVTTSESAAA